MNYFSGFANEKDNDGLLERLLSYESDDSISNLQAYFSQVLGVEDEPQLESRDIADNSGNYQQKSLWLWNGD